MEMHSTCVKHILDHPTPSIHSHNGHQFVNWSFSLNLHVCFTSWRQFDTTAISAPAWVFFFGNPRIYSSTTECDGWCIISIGMCMFCWVLHANIDPNRYTRARVQVYSVIHSKCYLFKRLYICGHLLHRLWRKIVFFLEIVRLYF